MTPLSKKKIKKIMVRSANWVGDAVMTMPVMRALKGHFPSAHIDILAKPWVMPVFENCPYIDGLFVYDASVRHKRWAGIFRLIKDIRKEKYDLAVLMQNAFEAAFISYFAGIPNILGYNTDARSFLLSHPVPMTPEIKKRHQVRYYLGILENSGIDAKGDRLELFLSEKEKNAAGFSLEKMGMKDGAPVIGISPGAEFGTAKRWQPERYAELCKALIQDAGAGILIFGSPKEAVLGESIYHSIGDRYKCFNLCGKTTLREAMTFMDHCDLFITNDSGLMHVAAALGKKLIAIFGSTNHLVTSPYGENCLMLRHETPCSPCMKPECSKETHLCMEAVSVDEVSALSKELLKNA